MKAAVLEKLGEVPVYKDFEAPNPSNNELIMNVKAASIKNLDKLRASGTHYASYKEVPVVVGIDAVGVLENGTKVYAQGTIGTIAEQTLISADRYTILPENIDYDVAAALPNAVLGATMALKSRAKIEKGNIVLINGATGVTGQIAVQIAKYYGAKKIIVTGRNQEVLDQLRALGADEIITLKQDEEHFITQIKQIHHETPIDIVLDYIWGHPMEMILKALKGGGINSFTHPLKVVTVGDMAGKTITLDSGTLRSSDIHILGSGLGSLSKKDIEEFDKEILPEMFQLAAKGQLKIDVVTYPLEKIQEAWISDEKGKRVVVLI